MTAMDFVWFIEVDLCPGWQYLSHIVETSNLIKEALYAGPPERVKKNDKGWPA